MGRIIAISSGDLYTTEAMNKYAIRMVIGATKRVLFIGTASHDAEGYIEAIRNEFTGLGCEEVMALELTRKEYSKQELREMIFRADIIYVGGGDTIFMYNEWKKRGIDALLREVYEKDTAVLMGISAGAMCWFSGGCTDSELAEIKPGLKYGLAEELLGIYPQIFCPHYEDRVEDFAELLKGKKENAFALESQNNFLQYAVSSLSNYADSYLDSCQRLGYRANMTGSGSAYYVAFDNKEQAQSLVQQLSAEGYNTTLCSTVPSGIELV